MKLKTNTYPYLILYVCDNDQAFYYYAIYLQYSVRCLHKILHLRYESPVDTDTGHAGGCLVSIVRDDARGVELDVLRGARVARVPEEVVDALPLVFPHVHDVLLDKIVHAHAVLALLARRRRVRALVVEEAG